MFEFESSVTATMASPGGSTVLDPLDSLENLLTELTDGVLPGQAATIQEAAPLKLESTLTDLIEENSIKLPKDKALVKVLGHIALITAAQLRQARDQIEQAKVH